MSLLILASVRNKIVSCIVTVSVSVHIEMFLSVRSPQVLNGRLGGRQECSRGGVQACMGAPRPGLGPPTCQASVAPLAWLPRQVALL